MTIPAGVNIGHTNNHMVEKKREMRLVYASNNPMATAQREMSVAVAGAGKMELAYDPAKLD